MKNLDLKQYLGHQLNNLNIELLSYYLICNFLTDILILNSDLIKFF